MTAKPFVRWMQAAALLVLASLTTISVSATQEPAPGAKPTQTDVFVLASLYRRHQSTAAYDLPALRRTILAIRPDVLVLDCTPNELKEGKVHASKIEYTGVIFPLLREGRYAVVPAEPDEPMFSEIVQSVGEERKRFSLQRPETAAALETYVSHAYAALGHHWQSPAAIHDEVTATVLKGVKALEDELYGPANADGQRRWNRHWTEAILRAVAEHPGKRVLAVTGVENRPFIVEALRQDPRVKMIDMVEWLRAHAGN